MKAIEFRKDLTLDGRAVRDGDVIPAADLPADHVACAIRLGYAAEAELPDPPAGGFGPPAKPAKK